MWQRTYTRHCEQIKRDEVLQIGTPDQPGRTGPISDEPLVLDPGDYSLAVAAQRRRRLPDGLDLMRLNPIRWRNTRHHAPSIRSTLNSGPNFRDQLPAWDLEGRIEDGEGRHSAYPVFAMEEIIS